MLGLILGGGVGVISWLVTWPFFVLGTWWMGLIMLVIPPWLATAPFDVAFIFCPFWLPPVIGGVAGFLIQVLGPNAVMDMASGTMGACVVGMDSCLDCVSTLTGGILGPCMGLVGGMMGGGGGEGGGLMGM